VVHLTHFGALSGVVNGVNTDFTVSQGEYASGTLEVYVNGQLQTQGTNEDYIELSAGSGTFRLNAAPASGGQVTAKYAVSTTTSDDVLVVREMQETTSATFTLTSSHLGVDCDATSNPITVNLPALATVQGIMFYVSKGDSSVNAITIDPNGTETVNGATTNSSLLTSQYNSIILVPTPTEWRIF
jgi:hypothetical protein